MALASRVKNIRYLLAPRHTDSDAKTICISRRQQGENPEILRYTYQAQQPSVHAISTCGFLGKLYEKSIKLSQSCRNNRCSYAKRYPACCRGPPASKFFKNSDAHRRNRYEI